MICYWNRCEKKTRSVEVVKLKHSSFALSKSLWPTDNLLGPSQKDMMEHFCKNAQQVLVAKCFYEKAAS